jgi:hypothetical protein
MRVPGGALRVSIFGLCAVILFVCGQCAQLCIQERDSQALLLGCASQPVVARGASAWVRLPAASPILYPPLSFSDFFEGCFCGHLAF